MVSAIIKFLNRETKNIHQAAYLLAIFTFLSQILGLIRDRIFAHFFGAGTELDIYYGAFRIPDLIFTTVASLVSVSILVPYLIGLGSDKYRERKFIDSIFTVFLFLMVIVIIIIFILMPYLTELITPGLNQDILVPLSRILLLSPLILGLSNLCGGITQAKEKFVAYALSPMFYNLGIIIGVLSLYPIYGLYGIAVGVVLGSIMHLLILLPSLLKTGIFPRFTLKVSWKEVVEVFRLSIPRTLTLAMNHIIIIVLVGLASMMTVGSISVFIFSFNLQSVPMALIGVSYSLAAFPMLSRLFNEGKKNEFLERITNSLSHVIFWSIPVTILFIVLRAQIVRTILGSGEFDWSDTRLTAAVASIFVISVVAQNVSLLLIRARYASGYTKKPFIQSLAGIISSMIVLIFGYLFFLGSDAWIFIEELFRVTGLIGTEVLLLPIAFSVGAIIQMILLWCSFERENRGFSTKLRRVSFQSFASSIIGGYASYLTLDVLDESLDLTTVGGVFLQGFLAGIIGIVVVVLVLRLVGNQEIAVVFRTLRSKIWKAKALTEDTHGAV